MASSCYWVSALVFSRGLCKVTGCRSLPAKYAHIFRDINSAHKHESWADGPAPQTLTTITQRRESTKGCKPLLKRNSVIALAHSLRCSSVLSSGQPAISANRSEWRGPADGREELPSESIHAIEATCCVCQRLEWGWEREIANFKL